MHNVFNEVLLTPFVKPRFSGQRLPKPPSPVSLQDTRVYEVEEVLDSRVVRGTLHYLVKWKGFPREEWTWEPARNLAGATKAVQSFHRKNPTKPKKAGLRIVDFNNPPNSQVTINWSSGKFGPTHQDDEA
jgi:hypothetical protein